MSSVRKELGDYEILGPLGAGGMGEVYVARDPVLGRKVAIKVLPVRLASDRDTLTRFTQEARSASALNHPNIVTIYEVGSDAGTPYIVMEHIEGKDLRSYINEAPIPNRKLLDIAAQIADGLAAAHEQNIVHRDLKPENLMVTKDGFVKILDFGLAKIIRPTGETDVTMELEMPGTTPGTILGTVGYMSPEQATGRPLDFRSDQFALGAILYELATGRPAFDGETAIDTLSSILHTDPQPIPKINAKAPPPLCWIVDRLLSKEQKDRYASTRDLAHELHSVRDRLATEQSDAFVMPRRNTHRPLLYIGLFVVILGTAGIVVTFKQPTAPAIHAAVPEQKKYLAVLRFQDLTGEPNGQLVADGFAETLTARLARFQSVQIMRPATPDAASSPNVQQVAKDLGANLALTGSMQKDGDKVRVTYHILDVKTGRDRTDIVDGALNDLFKVQDKLADSVAVALSLGTAPALPSLDPQISQRRYLEALGHLRHNDNEGSVDNAIKILEDLGASASVQASLGQAYLAKFQLTHDSEWAAKASIACDHARSADPQNPDVHIVLGELCRRTGRNEEATAEYQRALATEPNNAVAVTGLADAYNAAGDLVKAEVEYKKAIRLQENYWNSYNKLGGFYLAHGRYNESVPLFQRVLALSPDSLWGQSNLGAAYEQLGRYDEAITLFRKAIEKKPTGQAYSNIGTCLYFLGRFPEAAQAFEESVKLAPQYTLYWANLGDAYLRSSQPEKAREAYGKAERLALDHLTLNPRDTLEHRTLAVCYARLGRMREADEHIQIAQQIDPQDVNSLYRAATIANIEGQTDKATRLLEMALARGYSRSVIARDPEFTNLRTNGTIAGLLGNRP